MSHDRLVVFWMFTALLAAGAVFAGWWLWENGWRALFAEPYEPRHVDLPRPGGPAGASMPAARPGQQGWDEPDDDDATLAFFTQTRHELHDEAPTSGNDQGWVSGYRGPDMPAGDRSPESGSLFPHHDGETHGRATAPVAIDYRTPDGPAIQTTRIHGVHLPLTADTITDMRAFQPHAGPAAWQPARANPRVPCRDQRQLPLWVQRELGAPSVDAYFASRTPARLALTAAS